MSSVKYCLAEELTVNQGKRERSVSFKFNHGVWSDACDKPQQHTRAVLEAYTGQHNIAGNFGNINFSLTIKIWCRSPNKNSI